MNINREHISVVIPNYNGMNHLEVCLNSLLLQNYNDFNVIIVDNGSSDDSVDYIKKQYPQFEVISLNSNTGFSVAVNYGIKRALEHYRSSFILLLNNDIQCDPNFIKELRLGLNEPETGSVTPKMLNYYKRNIIDDTGNFVSKTKMPYPRGQGEIDKDQYSENEFVFGACAGAALYRKEIFEVVGLFDEDYFAYYEDIDLSFRIQYSGYKCKYVPTAICYHKRGGTISGDPNLYIYLIERNLFILRLKTYPFTVLLFNSPYYAFSRIIRFLRYLKNHSFSYTFSAIKGYLSAIIRIPKTIKKRNLLWKNKKVSTAYIKNLFT